MSDTNLRRRRQNALQHATHQYRAAREMISYAEARVEAAKVALFEAQQYYAALEEQYNADSQQLSALFADYKAARDAGDEVAIEGVLQPLELFQFFAQRTTGQDGTADETALSFEPEPSIPPLSPEHAQLVRKISHCKDTGTRMVLSHSPSRQLDHADPALQEDHSSLPPLSLTQLAQNPARQPISAPTSLSNVRPRKPSSRAKTSLSTIHHADHLAHCATIVYNGKTEEWVELRCHICGSNSSRSGLFNGVDGLHRHIIQTHSNMTSGTDEEMETCTHRVVPWEEVERIVEFGESGMPYVELVVGNGKAKKRTSAKCMLAMASAADASRNGGEEGVKRVTDDSSPVANSLTVHDISSSAVLPASTKASTPAAVQTNKRGSEKRVAAILPPHAYTAASRVVANSPQAGKSQKRKANVLEDEN